MIRFIVLKISILPKDLQEVYFLDDQFMGIFARNTPAMLLQKIVQRVCGRHIPVHF
jgi:hypothetical protein